MVQSAAFSGSALYSHIITPGGPSSYVNPFGYGSWSASRTDQGVDYVPNQPSPVVAIGNGVIVQSSTSSGWPGGAWIAYQLTDGPQAGQIVYVAEHLRDLLPVGTQVTAGQQIALAIPGYPWTEWGWADPSGLRPAVPYNGLPDGTPTEGGKMFARFLRALGAPVEQDPGAGPVAPNNSPAPTATLLAKTGGAGGTDVSQFTKGLVHLGQLLLGIGLMGLGGYLVVKDLTGIDLKEGAKKAVGIAAGGKIPGRKAGSLTSARGRTRRMTNVEGKRVATISKKKPGSTDVKPPRTPEERFESAKMQGRQRAREAGPFPEES